jgi:hypothetical protein
MVRAVALLLAVVAASLLLGAFWRASGFGAVARRRAAARPLRAVAAWRAQRAEAARAAQVNVPKAKKTYCKKCKKHAAHKVTQYKTGKASLFAQGARPTRSWA